jgi:lipoate-protein ligase B
MHLSKFHRFQPCGYGYDMRMSCGKRRVKTSGKVNVSVISRREKHSVTVTFEPLNNSHVYEES